MRTLLLAGTVNPKCGEFMPISGKILGARSGRPGRQTAAGRGGYHDGVRTGVLNAPRPWTIFHGITGDTRNGRRGADIRRVACHGSFAPTNKEGSRVRIRSRHLRRAPYPRGRRQALRLFQPPGRRRGRAWRHFPSAVLPQGSAGEPVALGGRAHGHRRRHQGGGGMADRPPLGPRDRLPPGAGPDAGLHRRARHRRPGRHARGDGGHRRRSQQDQPAVAGRSGHRPFGDGRFLGQPGRLPQERGDGVRAQPRALRVPALGPGGVQGSPRRAPGHRHLPPGQPGIPGPGGVDHGKERRHRRLSRHPGRHRQPHDHDQRPFRARLGGGRHRGRGGYARPAHLHAHPGGRRLQDDRQAEGRHHGHRPGAHRGANSEGPRRGRQVRRVPRPRPGPPDPRRPGDHRQHGPGIRGHLRLLSR